MFLETCILLYLFLGVTESGQEVSVDKELGKAINQFGDNVYRQLSQTPGNIIFSPISAHSALTLLSLGAEGDTYRELVSSLFLTDVQNLRRSYINIRRDLCANRSLRLASNLFVAKNLSIDEHFKQEAKEMFAANPQNVDFKNPHGAAAVINKWVADHTNKKVTEIVDESSLHDNMLMLLLNAIYFKGKWKLKFDKSQTIENYVFHATKGDVECNMMYMKRRRQKYAAFRTFDMLELDFEGTNAKIVFVRPSGNITTVEQTLNDKVFFQSVAQLHLQNVEIKIPKFKLSSSFSLKNILVSLGLHHLYRNSDFSHIFKKKLPTSVDDVLQKSFIEINEDGAEGAASTAVVINIRSAPVTRFVLDKPFLFYLYDSKTHIVMMRGRIDSPEKTE